MAAKMATTINNELDQKSDTEAGSFLGGLFGGLFPDMGGMGMSVVALLVLCCCCCCCVLLLGGGGFALYSSQNSAGTGEVAPQQGGSHGIYKFLKQLIRKIKTSVK
jgi:hypothetical protein